MPRALPLHEELFLDSATDVCILSAVPYNDDGQPLPIEEAAKTCQWSRALRKNEASLHAPLRVPEPRLARLDVGRHVRPGLLARRARPDDRGGDPARSRGTGYLKAWKVYCPWGDVPYTTGWWLDGAMGQQFIAHAEQLAAQYGVPR